MGPRESMCVAGNLAQLVAGPQGTGRPALHESALVANQGASPPEPRRNPGNGSIRFLRRWVWTLALRLAHCSKESPLALGQMQPVVFADHAACSGPDALGLACPPGGSFTFARAGPSFVVSYMEAIAAQLRAAVSAGGGGRGLEEAVSSLWPLAERSHVMQLVKVGSHGDSQRPILL